MRVDILNKTLVAGGTADLQHPAENLSPIDASPLLLKTVNSPSLKFSYSLDLATLHQATVDLLQEYPIVAGRIRKTSKHEHAKHAYLKAAPYSIDISAADAGIMLYEAQADVAASDVLLNRALADPFGLTPGSVVLPPWYQPLDVCALLQGKEPLLKLQLTHCTDGGSILAATMPHLLVDSHSSTLLLTRLSELYRQHKDSSSLTTPIQTAAVIAATHETEQLVNVTPSSGSYAGNSTSMAGVVFQPLRSSAQELTKPMADGEAVASAAAAAAVTAPSAAKAAEATAAATAGIRELAGEGSGADSKGSLSGTSSVWGRQSGGVPGVAYERLSLTRISSGKAMSVVATAAAASPGESAVTAAAAAAVSPVTAAAAAVVEIKGQTPPKLPVPDASFSNSKLWSKALLLPRDRKAILKPSTLKALSLDLQSVDQPSFGSTLSWLAAAFKAGLAANKAFHGAASRLSSILISIPQSDVAQLKAVAAAGFNIAGTDSRPISTNDAISALVWLTFCDLRGRPLPGTSSTSSSSSKPCKSFTVFSCGSQNMPREAETAAAAEGGALGLAIDLRQNCADLKQVPGNYFGNAAWCLHIVSNGQTAVGDSHTSSSIHSGRSNAEDAAAPAASVAAPDMYHVSPIGGSSYASALQFAAAAVRRRLTSFRQSKAVGDTLLQLVEAQQAARMAVLVRNLSRLAVHVDAFVTSWQFPVQQVDFGGGAAAEYCCVVRPTPPWQAAVLPSRPSEGGTQLLLTVPASAVHALKASPVLKQLVPNASFQ